MRHLSEKYANVPRPVQNANDLNTFRNRAIKDDVFAYGIAAQLRCKVRSSSPEFWHLRQYCTFFVDFIKPTISGSRIFFGNPQRDFDKIKVCPTGSQNSRHQSPFLISRLRTFSLILGISNGAISPRSASSIPKAISRRSSSWRRRCMSLDSPSQRYSSQRSWEERRFVADLTSATVLIRRQDNARIVMFQ